jgi:hypothetical protein
MSTCRLPWIVKEIFFDEFNHEIEVILFNKFLLKGDTKLIDFLNTVKLEIFMIEKFIM